MNLRPSVLSCRQSRRLPALGLCACVLLAFSGCRGGVKGLTARLHPRRATSPPNTTDYAGELERLLNTPTLPQLRWPDYSAEQAAVQKFYADRDHELAWTRDGRPTPSALVMLRQFKDAAGKGLNPEDYDASDATEGRWADRLQQLALIARSRDDSASAQGAIAGFDLALTICSVRYLEDLHSGRINPETLNFDIDAPQKRAAFDAATLLNDRVVDASGIPSVIQSVEPRNPLYQRTEEALATYRLLAMEESAVPPLPLPALPPGARPVGVGGWYAALPRLWARLQFLGDVRPSSQPRSQANSQDNSQANSQANSEPKGSLAQDATPQFFGAEVRLPKTGAPAARPPSLPPRSYTLQVALAVKLYQEQHGLQPDGRLGHATIASLNTPMSVRVQQLDDALERWRWLPQNYLQPRVLVNLPEFMVRVYDPDNTLAFKMKVVTGEAKDHHATPMFVRLMRYVVFRPYWNLPPSIVRKDLVPDVKKKGLKYLAANDYQLYRGNGAVVTRFTLHDLEHLRYNVRQLPGPKNALGLVKFLFPNAYDVYMHSTPELNLFSLTRRDRSHGCVRLQHAGQMALWVLHGDQKDPDQEDGWDADKIDLAMTGPLNNRTVNLRTPLPVVIGYFTALPDEDGSIHFFDDLYGYDKDLEAALAKGRPYEHTEAPIHPSLTPGETE
ncbi:MAG: murein L,D-transpeptidase [Acidobacteriota bacterium]